MPKKLSGLRDWSTFWVGITGWRTLLRTSFVHFVKPLLYLGVTSGFGLQERFPLYVQVYLKMSLNLRLVPFTEKTRNPTAIVFSCQITYQVAV